MASRCPPRVTVPFLVPNPVPWMKRFAPSASAWRISGPSPWSEESCLPGSFSRHWSRSSFPFPLSLPARAFGANASAAVKRAMTPRCDLMRIPWRRYLDWPDSRVPGERKHFGTCAPQLRHEAPCGVVAGSGRAWSRFPQHPTTRCRTPPDVLRKPLVDSTHAVARAVGGGSGGIHDERDVSPSAALDSQPRNVSMTMMSSRSTASLSACCSSPSMSARMRRMNASICWTVQSTSAPSSRRLNSARAAR